MENLLKLSLIGVGAYLLWDYLSKKNKNEAVVSAAPTEPDGSEQLFEAAEMQQLGYGSKVSVVSQAKQADEESNNTTMSSFVDGWDSDVLSKGI